MNIQDLKHKRKIKLRKIRDLKKGQKGKSRNIYECK